MVCICLLDGFIGDWLFSAVLVSLKALFSSTAWLAHIILHYA